jgi:tRNA(fMet)-specific endonuclease VapC
MILLDTDTVSLFHAGHAQVTERVAKVDPAEVVGTTIITRAEILRARLEFLLKAEDGEQLQRAQERLDSSESLLADLPIVAFRSAKGRAFAERKPTLVLSEPLRKHGLIHSLS